MKTSNARRSGNSAFRNQHSEFQGTGVLKPVLGTRLKVSGADESEVVARALHRALPECGTRPRSSSWPFWPLAADHRRLRLIPSKRASDSEIGRHLPTS